MDGFSDRGSTPLASTILEKSELIPNRECVRIFCLYQRHYILMFMPRGLTVLWAFCFIHTFEFLSAFVYNTLKEVVNMVGKKRKIILSDFDHD